MPKEINVTLGIRVKECRKIKGYTREAFSEKISISPRFLASIEDGEAGVSITTLKKIALELNVTVDYLLGIEKLDKTDLLRTDIISKINRLDDKHLEDVNRILESILNIANSKDKKD